MCELYMQIFRYSIARSTPYFGQIVSLTKGNYFSSVVSLFSRAVLTGQIAPRPNTHTQCTGDGNKHFCNISMEGESGAFILRRGGVLEAIYDV